MAKTKKTDAPVKEFTKDFIGAGLQKTALVGEFQTIEPEKQVKPGDLLMYKGGCEKVSLPFNGRTYEGNTVNEVLKLTEGISYKIDKTFVVENETYCQTKNNMAIDVVLSSKYFK